MFNKNDQNKNFFNAQLLINSRQLQRTILINKQKIKLKTN